MFFYTHPLPGSKPRTVRKCKMADSDPILRASSLTNQIHVLVYSNCNWWNRLNLFINMIVNNSKTVLRSETWQNRKRKIRKWSENQPRGAATTNVTWEDLNRQTVRAMRLIWVCRVTFHFPGLPRGALALCESFCFGPAYARTAGCWIRRALRASDPDGCAVKLTSCIITTFTSILKTSGKRRTII